MSVLVYAEQVDGLFKKATYELITYGEQLAKATSLSVVVVVIGDLATGELEKLSYYGAANIIRVTNHELVQFNSQAYSSGVCQVAKKVDAKYVLFQNNFNTHALAPRVAARLQAGLVSGVMALPKSYSPCIVRKKVFSGKAYVDIQLNSEIKVLCLNPNSLQAEKFRVDCVVSDFVVELPISFLKQEVTQVDRVQGKIPVTEAERIVSAGRGLKGPENWTMIEDLADALNASTACSKPVADMGWRPHDEHVGQTGKFVSPNLYLAIGISGAIQHISGISSSKIIVAVNTDAEAPIFEVADYGIVGDAFKVVPALIKAARDLKE